MRYANGEIVLKSRMENEDWYPDYQALVEIATFRLDEEDARNCDKILNAFIKDWEEIHQKICPAELQDQALRWAVLHAERTDWLQTQV